MKKILLSLSLLLIITSYYSQITVNNTAPYNTAANLVNNVLLGSGVTASNITFTGNPAQIGFFSSGLNGVPNLGLDSGIIMSTGDINDIPSGGNQPNQGQYGGAGDPDLLTVAQSVTSNPQAGNITQTQDAAFLEFDFVPAGDSVKFNFVFASEEYPGGSGGATGFVNQLYNDVFAFYVSGPGITGPFSSPSGFPNGAVNIAVVPGTSIPITISTIYVDPAQTPPSLNAQFYVDNTTEQNNDFNAFTTVISIVFPVTCGEIYHFKIAIADAQDDFLDTGVFLEGSSFSSDAVQVDVATATGDSTIIEGCDPAIINFTRPDTNGVFTVHYIIGGNAINGTDYVTILDSITFPAGIDTATLTITAIADAIIEGTDTITITTLFINACGDTITSTGVIFIIDIPNMVINAPDVTLTCPSNTIPIQALVSGAVPPFVYVWTDSQGNPIGTNNDTIIVSGLQTDTFYVEVTDGCNLITIRDSIIVTLNYTLPTIINLTPDDTISCGASVNLQATMNGGTAPYIYTWLPGGVGSPINVIPDSTTTYQLSATDFCGTIILDSVKITVDTIPVLITTSNNDTINCGEQVTLTASPIDGVSVYTYTWTPGGANPLTVSPFQTTTYSVIANGGCGASATETVTITVDTIPVSITVTRDTILFCTNQSVNLNAEPTDGTSIYTNYQWTPGGAGANITVSPTQTTTYSISADGFCGATTTEIVTVTVIYTPMTIDLTNDIPLECSNLNHVVEIVGTIINGTAPYTYNWGAASTDTDSIINISVNSPQNISVTVFDACGEQITDNMSITFSPYTPMILTTELVDSICQGTSTNLLANVSNGLAPYIYSWSNGGTNSSPTFSSEDIGLNTVLLTVTDQCQLQEFGSVEVEVIGCAVTIPNVITPNNDGMNDFLVFEQLDLFPNNNLVVFNRWGKKIFEKQGYQNNWNGDNYAEGTYFFVLELNDFENTIHKGTITLLK